MSAETAAERLATLTPEEDRRWQNLFSDYLNDNHPYSSAGRLAWEEMKREFPRLAAFDGFAFFDQTAGANPLDDPDSL